MRTDATFAKRPRIIRAAIAVSVLYVVQYLAISNTGVGLYTSVSDTLPYADLFSYVRLPRSLVLALYPLLRVVKFPLQPLLSRVTASPQGHWSRGIATLLTPFGSASESAVKANHLVIAAANTLIWAAFIAALWFVARRVRSRPRASGAGGV